MDEKFTDCHKISLAVTVANGAAGTSAIQGAILDMSGFDKIAVMVTFGAIVSNAVTSFKVEQSDASDMSGSEDIAGSNQTVADTKDGKIFLSDMVRPTKRYIRLLVSRATQNATLVAHYIQGGADNKPVTQSSDVAATEGFKDAAGGTA